MGRYNIVLNPTSSFLYNRGASFQVGMGIMKSSFYVSVIGCLSVKKDLDKR